ncbi:RNA polymerase sigma-70 factor, ECF subfamily [Andreprevotia lacus DSM 23236]|jgi:RNA polymerase sigma-70 factor (ECF subfamily)|uniref:RNA polymerase sigma-70 factor, ECF subfamily n=1 Tax=Andreprevotia lacus DSM 23236 TaxID=1121001 RepID=A0A1W1XNF3_9NEIS|nr:sigma-70 family RNA polymerase sigma factor [Andreprevotia lacus]SMC25436.1 RNA polymerase sigma-70 factor, ECF subfamily [Andreprevotia lacus DSM 23236]
MSEADFEARLRALRPRLHRYCARMTGSAIDGEDVLQDALVKALHAQADGAMVDNLGGWLLRIAHNCCLDFLRRRARVELVPLDEGMAHAARPDTDIVTLGFHAFLQLPELQRCAVILKDVLGHTVEEIAAIAGSTPAAAKSALQRGRSTLRQRAAKPIATPARADAEKLASYVQLFQQGDFDAIRALLAEDVQLELVNRLKLAGREQIAPYFSRYAAEPKWCYALGTFEQHPAMLVYDHTRPDQPAHMVLLEWRQGRIASIRDFLFAAYVLDGAAWRKLQGRLEITTE